MFQYSYRISPPWGHYVSVEDTGLITYAAAKKLWSEHLPDFISKLKDDAYEPEMGIWINCVNDTNYHTCQPHVDNDTKTDGTNLWNIIEERVTV